MFPRHQVPARMPFLGCLLVCWMVIGSRRFLTRFFFPRFSSWFKAFSDLPQDTFLFCLGGCFFNLVLLLRFSSFLYGPPFLISRKAPGVRGHSSTTLIRPTRLAFPSKLPPLLLSELFIFQYAQPLVHEDFFLSFFLSVFKTHDHSRGVVS